MDSYFTKFPTIYYNGTLCKDISRSARFTEESRNQTSLFYPVEIDAGFRADNLAEAYYQDSEMDWLIWLTNDIIDPYYDWYLSEQEFENFIVSKYGDYPTAIKKIKFYRNNWSKLDESISPSFYENSLALDLKKYYTPVFGSGTKILNYIRKQEDWSTNTNRIIKYTLTGNVAFTNSEFVDIKYLGETVGTATVINSNTSQVTIQHVSGNTTANSTWIKTLVGETSNVSVNTVSSSIVKINISDDEAIFWDPVTALDIEQEYNESKKNLFVINSDYALDVSEQLRLKLRDI